MREKDVKSITCWNSESRQIDFCKEFRHRFKGDDHDPVQERAASSLDFSRISIRYRANIAWLGFGFLLSNFPTPRISVVTRTGAQARCQVKQPQRETGSELTSGSSTIYAHGATFRGAQNVDLTRPAYETVRSWLLKFGPVIARRLPWCRPRLSNSWHLDEMVVRIAGKRMYSLRAPTTMARSSTYRFNVGATAGLAMRLKRKILMKQGLALKMLVTDKLRSYPRCSGV
jgi:hypothetical protein